MADLLVATPPPLTEQAADLDSVWSLFIWIAAAVGVLVALLLGWTVTRYRRRDAVLPVQRHQHIPIEITYTLIPLGIVAVLFGVTVASIHRVDDDAAEPDLVVDVTAFQWQWKFDYPESGASSQAAGDANPELVLPAGATVKFELTSLDVLHSFWVPGFRFKRDIFPGETTSFQVDVSETTGEYPDSGVCAEFCGIDHHKMRFDVRIVTPAEFDVWVAEHQNPGEAP
jgi:cytochrome c oxidase subunit 2